MIRDGSSLSDCPTKLQNTRTLGLPQVLGRSGLGASPVKYRLSSFKLLLTDELAHRPKRASSLGLMLVRLLPTIQKWYQYHKDGSLIVYDMYCPPDLGRQRQLAFGP